MANALGAPLGALNQAFQSKQMTVDIFTSIPVTATEMAQVHPTIPAGAVLEVYAAVHGNPDNVNGDVKATAFKWCACHGYIDLVRFLWNMHHSCLVCCVTMNNIQSMLQACANQEYGEIFKFLCEHFDVQADFIKRDKSHLLLQSLQDGHFEAFSFLLARYYTAEDLQDDPFKLVRLFCKYHKHCTNDAVVKQGLKAILDLAPC